MPILSSQQTSEQKKEREVVLSAKQTKEQNTVNTANKAIAADQASKIHLQKDMASITMEEIDKKIEVMLQKILDGKAEMQELGEIVKAFPNDLVEERIEIALKKSSAKMASDVSEKILSAMNLNSFKGSAKDFYEHINNKISKAAHDEIIQMMHQYGKIGAPNISDTNAELVILKLVMKIDIANERDLEAIKDLVEKESIKSFYKSAFNVEDGYIFSSGPSYVSKGDLLKFMVNEIKSLPVADQKKEIEKFESFIAMKVAEDVAKYHNGDLKGVAEVAVAHLNDIDSFLVDNPNVNIHS